MDVTSPGHDPGWPRAVLDRLPTPVLLVEAATGRVLYANRAAAVVPLAGDAAARVTDHSGELIPWDQYPLRRVSRGERLAAAEVAWPSAGGGTHYYLVDSDTLTEPPGLAVVSFADVTRLKSAEDELRQAVSVRDEFFSFATHELKDPLSSLLLSVEVLIRMAARQGTVPTPVLTERLEVSKRQGERLARVVENLLDVSRITNRRLRPDLEALDLCSLVREVAARFRDEAREAGVELSADVGEGVPVIGYFDRVQVEHVVGNLLSNAIKYGAGRPVALRVACDDEWARVEVEDNGPGIAEADHGRVFERFERANDGHRAKSLGLGLYIVRSFVEAHGGTVTLRSAPGRGSTFAVRLPRKRLPGPEPAGGGNVSGV